MKKQKINCQKRIVVAAFAILSVMLGGSAINLNKTEASDKASQISPPQAAVPTNGRIAFISTRHQTVGSEVYTMNADGSDVQRITTNNTNDDSNPVWSPDGTKIVFMRHMGSFNSPQLFVINADGSGETRLTNNSASDLYPTWSPTGTQIAFASTRDGNVEIYKMNADGTNQTRLTDRAGEDTEPDWSPDGTKIAYARETTAGDHRITTMDTSGGNVTLITSPSRTHRNPAWSPDGSKIVFRNGDNGLEGLCTVSLDGTNLFRVVEDTGFNGVPETPDWSPDGTKIIYFRNAIATGSQLYTSNALGGGEVMITPTTSHNYDPSWLGVDVQTPRRPKVDFNGDGKNDFVAYRPTTGEWWIRYHPGVNPIVAHWGNDPSDKPVAADFTGDGATDLCIYRASEGTWWVLNSPASPVFYTFAQHWGGDPSDIPVAGDYNGDGRAELAIFRRSEGTWWIVNAPGAANPYINIRQWGNPDDIPVAEDYDGDGKWDLAIYRPSTGEWWVSYSSNGQTVIYRLEGDIPVPGDYDGDNKADFAVYSSTGIYAVRTGSGFIVHDVGHPNGTPTAVDFDGDGKSDFAAIQRDGNPLHTAFWVYHLSSTGTFDHASYGKNGDLIPSEPFIP